MYWLTCRDVACGRSKKEIPCICCIKHLHCESGQARWYTTELTLILGKRRIAEESEVAEQD